MVRLPSHTRNQKPRGFTLIELMIVVTIIGLLASVAIPQYQRIVLASKRTERGVMIASMMKTMNDYWVSNGKFPGGGNTVTLLPNPPFPIDGSKQPFSSTLGRWGDLNWRPDGPLYYRYEVSGATTGTTGTLFVTARSDLDHANGPSIFTVTYTLEDGVWQRYSEVESGDAF